MGNKTWKRPAKWGPGAVWLGWALFVIGLFGVRRVIPSTFWEGLFHTSAVMLVIRPGYWLALAGGFALLAFYASSRWKRWAALAVRVKANGLLLCANVLAATPFLFLVISKRVYLDFWLDETISIRRHIVTTIDRALFWYPIPNNHVFTNALAGIYLKLLGAKDLRSVLDNPQVLRAFFMAFGLGAMAVSACVAYRFVNRRASIVVVILWTTSIAFLNFAAQARGYAPSLFFVAALLWALLEYRRVPRLNSGLAILALAAMLVYTMPSNVYWLGSVAIFFGVESLLDLRLNKGRFTWKPGQVVLVNPAFSISTFIGLGTLVAVLLYLPILPDVMDNKYVQSLGWLQGPALSLIPNVLQAFISGRWILFALAGAGLALGALLPKKRHSEWGALALFLGCSLLLPFVLSTVRWR